MNPVSLYHNVNLVRVSNPVRGSYNPVGVSIFISVFIAEIYNLPELRGGVGLLAPAKK